MFCPKCEDELVNVRGELTCERGDMGLSQDMARRLTECFILRLWTPREHNVITTSGTWFCPAHGILMMHEENGIARCPECRLSINAFIYQLTELHPHADIDISDNTR